MPPKMHGKPRVADVAREAGVSPTAASYVLSGSKGADEISARTKRRILAAAARLGYSRNAAATTLQRGYSSTMVLLAVTWDVALGHAHTIVAVSQAAVDRELATILYLAKTDEEASEFLRRVQSLNPYGLLLLWDSPAVLSSNISKLQSDGLPVIDLMPSSQEGIVSVTADRVRGCCLCAQHLIDLGHTRIGFILDTTTRWRTNNQKLAGYKRALEMADIRSDDSLLQETTGVDFESGYEGFKKLIDRRPDVTAVMCMNDPVALGAIAAANDLGLDVPADVSVAGYGAFREGAYFRPRLTSIRAESTKIAECATELVIATRENKLYSCSSVFEPMELVIRESTGPVSSKRR
ncbi:MAG: hypothetical protein A2Z18_00060 [Armatimonadetes bacterium RBG_16_58_9]|nr:MAG: hypothetical protein A2Z18_00060 [Armatimonadetes bacterium RBG_16_58_9]